MAQVAPFRYPSNSKESPPRSALPSARVASGTACCGDILLATLTAAASYSREPPPTPDPTERRHMHRHTHRQFNCSVY